MSRKEEAVRQWFPMAAITAGIIFVVTFILKLPLEQIIAATALSAVMIFSGFFFRSFGRDKDEYN